LALGSHDVDIHQAALLPEENGWVQRLIDRLTVEELAFYV
jgi:hypothetical protein